MTIVSLARRVRCLASVMSLAEAFKFALREKTPEDFHIRLSTGQEITLRGGTTDVPCFEQVFINKYYSSPFELSPLVIVDAGANTGMATLYFASRYPTARVIAIEPEPNNFKMLKRNCASLPNVVLVQAALWPVQCRLTIANDGAGEWAYSVTEYSAPQSTNEVSAITMAEIFRRLEVDKVDLLKLDIEGSERELFCKDATAWLDQVECIVIELHDRYRPGCAKAFYSALANRNFIQEVSGDNIFLHLSRNSSATVFREQVAPLGPT